MNITLSMSSRGLVYFPDALQKRLKLKRPGKFTMKLLDDNLVQMKPVGDFFELAGSLRDKAAPPDFDFRKYMEENYERL